jgi:DNA polymerase III epsilon subunit-like protein
MASWRWIGEKKIHSAHEWDEGGAPVFAQTVRDQMDAADIITGHYVNRADRRWLNSLFRDHGVNWPSPYQVIDTCSIARRDLGDESMTLGALCSRFGIPTKTGK